MRMVPLQDEEQEEESKPKTRNCQRIRTRDYEYTL